jgi:hypothetical protein
MTPSDLWRTNPWLTSHMIGAALGQGIDAEARRQEAALSDWEDEGGSTAGRASPDVKSLHRVDGCRNR